MNQTLVKTTRLALIAGEGELPLRVVESALNQPHLDIYVYALDRLKLRNFHKLLPKDQVIHIHPGQAGKTLASLKKTEIHQVVFAGKVNKWILLGSPLIDSYGLELLKRQKSFNDDALMLAMANVLEENNIQVVPQSDFLKDFFVQPGLYSKRAPSGQESQDISFGFSLAKEMGRLDIGQTVVVSHGMILAIEAIEGTDQAILRSKKWAGRKGGVVVKVEKPNQDSRFDIPTVGIRTLKAMKKANLKVLAVEAGKTFVLEFDKMVELANRWNISFVAV